MKLSARHALLALVIATIWGTTFVSMKVSLQSMPPLAVSAWRFALAAFPLLLFVGAPQAPWRWMLGYAFAIAVFQFPLLFLAMNLGFPAGLMSLVVQTQVFFTIALSVLLFRESVQRAQLIGALIAACGLVVIGADKLREGLLGGLALVLVAAFSWGVGNTIAKHVARDAAGRGVPKPTAMNFIAWTSACAVPPLIVLSLVFEPKNALFVPTAQVNGLLWFHLAWLAYGAQVFGYGLWANLLTRYPASAVSPFALWVPVAGMSATALAFGERLNAVQMVGAAIVIAGLAVAVLWPLQKRTT